VAPQVETVSLFALVKVKVKVVPSDWLAVISAQIKLRYYLLKKHWPNEISGAHTCDTNAFIKLKCQEFSCVYITGSCRSIGRAALS